MERVKLTPSREAGQFNIPPNYSSPGTRYIRTALTPQGSPWPQRSSPLVRLK